MIIDSHCHLPPIGDGKAFSHCKETFLKDLVRHKTDYAILIPDNIPGAPIGDVPTCLELMQSEPNIFLLGTIDIQRQGQEWIDVLSDLLKNNKLFGMKIFPGHDPIYPSDQRLFKVYSLCQEYRVPMVIHTGWNSNHPEVAVYNDPKYIVEVAMAFPYLPIVIAHYFWPEVEYCYQITRSCSNIYFDTSALADPEVIEATGKDKIRTVLTKTIVDNPETVLFGSDYACCDRGMHIELIKSLPISESVREMVFWKNAVKLFKLNIKKNGMT